MKLSQVLFFLPSTLALPSLHVSSNAHAALAGDCNVDFPMPGGDVAPCQDGYDTTPIIDPLFGDGNLCCKTPSSQGNNDLMKTVTTPTNICLRVLFPPDTKCQEGWELVQLGDSGFYTCCLSQPNGANNMIVMQDQAGSFQRQIHKGL